MTFGERLYLALVLIAFIAFANTLAVVAYRSERFLQRKGGDPAVAGKSAIPGRPPGRIRNRLSGIGVAADSGVARGGPRHDKNRCLLRAAERCADMRR